MRQLAGTTDKLENVTQDSQDLATTCHTLTSQLHLVATLPSTPIASTLLPACMTATPSVPLAVNTLTLTPTLIPACAHSARVSGTQTCAHDEDQLEVEGRRERDSSRRADRRAGNTGNGRDGERGEERQGDAWEEGEGDENREGGGGPSRDTGVTREHILKRDSDITESIRDSCGEYMYDFHMDTQRVEEYLQQNVEVCCSELWCAVVCCSVCVAACT